MKVLYISGAAGADYQCDLCMQGMRTLLGPDLVDVAKMWFMYDTSPHYMFHSLYKLLPDIEVDRENVEAKIQSQYFDAVVYGSVHRCRDYLDLVLASYPKNRIAFIDGEDGPELAPTVGRAGTSSANSTPRTPTSCQSNLAFPRRKSGPLISRAKLVSWLTATRATGAPMSIMIASNGTTTNTATHILATQ
jgi:hypothetical protein